MALSSQTPRQRPATLEDFLAIPAAERCHEILDGELVRKTTPSYDHGRAQSRLIMVLSPYDADDELHRGPGGWFLATEVEILLGQETPYRPDLVGWRSERMPEPPRQFPVPLRPDWICEIVSPSDEARDTIIKYRDYARAGIPYYWLLDLKSGRLTALRLQGEHYVLQAEGLLELPVRAEPFELVEIVVSRLLPPRKAPAPANH